MAENKQIKEKKNLDVKFEGLGTYKESTGGGTPIPKGETLAQHPEAKRVQQPRDENGQFTYNAANKKTLKYGPSRGKTIPPYLKIKGGIEEKEGEVRIKNDKVYNVSVKYTGYTKQQLIEDCKQYFEGVKDEGHEQGFKYQTKLGEVVFTAKKGRKSLAEKAAILSDYKGDIKGLKFGGDKKQIIELNKNYDKLLKTGKKKDMSLFLKKEDKEAMKPKEKASPVVAKPSSASVSNKFSDDDKKMAKENSEGFKQKYAKEFNEIKSLLDSKGYDLDEEAIVSAIANNDVSGFDEIKKQIEDIED